ncbi:peptidyl-prolyl cis-trans isomerase [Paenibacillus sp. DMB20]|uniref:peptidyl-prolyl cis-trans isomerase n=1 Tax=Paenibacillus sp. DMB20 TaxID=1642570 RepID=UPI0006277B51|nr:peptidyl-prolyl cis-trans isomerase [Paenibacillus sp. DMB20]KKO55151.1 peptidylprolyl isomerase [Paenibacillus sp. DMB20]
MTRQEKGLWVTVIVLTAVVLFMGSWMLFSGVLFQDAKKEPEVDSLAVASVQDRAITEEEWTNELKKRYGSEVLMTMMNRQVVELEAQAAGIKVSPEEVERELDRIGQGYGSKERFLQEMQEQLGLTEDMLRAETEYRLTLEKIATADIRIDEAEIDSYLNEHPDQFRPQKQLDLSFIKVASESEAEEVMDRLENGEDFAALAEEVSIDEYTRDYGGRIGLVEEDDPFQPAALMETARTLSKGDIAGPIRLEDGYAVVYVHDIIVPETLDEQLVREAVRKQLALEQAASLSELESRLRDKYAARMVAGIPGKPLDHK